MSDLNLALVVGIGASAGGLKPIEEFFRHTPTDCGMAFVIVQHLSPDFESLMDELLGRHTAMPIHRATDGIELEENQIYLIPPKKDLTISGGKLLLHDQRKTNGLNLPIDSFFSSLADQLGKNAAAVVLSGSGSDGARGVREIRSNGGLVIVQSPKSAGFDGMPQAAIKTQCADVVCDVNEMPEYLSDYRVHRDTSRFAFASTPVKEGAELAWLYELFRDRMGIDFSNYKPGTIQRRLDRRMQLSAVASTSEYRERLESEDSEVDALFRDLLVEVTHFYRDPKAFEILGDGVVENLLKASAKDETLRAWVCGCATGEEAYSVAMLIHDCMQRNESLRKPFKVFATDVHPKSVAFASEGVYAERSLRLLPELYRERYFNHLEEGYKVKQEIRERIIFAVNDVTNDPPFTKLNFVSCRNLLIYLLPKTQKHVLSLFHFALKKDGVLFLGPSETVSGLDSEFDEVSRHWRIFRKRREGRLSAMDSMPTMGHEAPLAKAQRITDRGEFRQQYLANSAVTSLLNRYVPSGVLVNSKNKVVYTIGNARELLTFPEGEPTEDVLKLLGRKLGVALGAALRRSRDTLETAVLNGVPIQFPGCDTELYQIKVDPVDSKTDGHFLVAFIKSERPETVVEETEVMLQPLENATEQIDHLKLELNYTRETLQATVEELESSNEELQATNEELVASNEELQSTNEELQSTNEELHTVNQENRQRIDQLKEVTDDLELLLSQTATGILFLDSELRIRKFTRSITSYFDLRTADIGRSIENFSHRTGVENLYEQFREALASGSAFELESNVANHEPLLIEVAVQGDAEQSTGVMITVGKKAVRGFGVASQQLQLPGGAGFWHWPDVNSDEMWWSPRCYQMLGIQDKTIIPAFSSWRKLVHVDDRHKLQNPGTEHCLFVRQGFLVVRMLCADDVYRPFEYRAAFVMNEHENPQSMMGSFAIVEKKDYHKDVGHERFKPHPQKTKEGPTAGYSSSD